MELFSIQPKQTTSARQYRFLWLAAIIVSLDQFTKIIVKLRLPLYESKVVWGDLILLTHVQNTGAAFSLSLGSPEINRFFFITMIMIAIVFVVYLLYRATTKLQLISFSLIIGGAVGNLIDRVLFGYVTDFIDVDFPDYIMQRWPVFNIADSAVVISMCLLILDMIIHRSPEHASGSDSQQKIDIP
ncbi:MAG: signal peptidase II [Candidatus Cloacimonetes bacterium]|nr:signal peptidase II [Candidatus Cloacimonadota bacterium]